MKNAKLVGIYVDSRTIVDNNKKNVTKRLVYDLGNNTYAVVKTFSNEQQDEDFNNEYRSVKIWKNAKIEKVASFWNTTKVVDNIGDYITSKMMKANVDTLKEFVTLDKVDIILSGYKF